MGLEKTLIRLLLYIMINILSFTILYSFDAEVHFMRIYYFFLGMYILTIITEKLLFREKFLFQLPIGNTFFAGLAFYFPVPVVYSTKLLKAISLPHWENLPILKTLFLTNLALQCVWIGYGIIKMIPVSSSPSRYTIRPRKIYPLFIIYFISVLLLISTGNYGITEQSEDDAKNYVTILTSIQQYGIFGLIFLTYYHYYKGKQFVIFGVTLAFFLLGLLSGMKENAISPVLTVGVTIFFLIKKVPKKLVIVGLLLALGTFPVVTAFRNVYLLKGKREINSIGDLAGTYVKSVTEGSKKKYNYDKLTEGQKVFYRLNYAGPMSQVFAYTEAHGYGLPYDSNPLHTFASPIYAIVPRFILPFKPLANFGKYVTSDVFGYGRKGATYSLGLSQTGYAYIWNGTIGVVILMLFVGMFQGMLYKFFYRSFMPIYIYLFIANIYVIDVVWAYTGSFMKFALLMLLAYIFLGEKQPAITPNAKMVE